MNVGFHQMCLDAVVLRFIAIGEATKQIPVSVTVRCPKIEWQKIAGIRDISVHSYYAVKPTDPLGHHLDQTWTSGGAVEGDDPGRGRAVEPAVLHNGTL
ncbi:MAG: DUF86 domain-containing protein [Methanomicrobiales archaeon]|nr:DUF86 domain-containing protein [Methanomicrobiales archaeon]